VNIQYLAWPSHLGEQGMSNVEVKGELGDDLGQKMRHKWDKKAVFSQKWGIFLDKYFDV